MGWLPEIGFPCLTPVFDGADEFEIEAELARAWLMDAAWMKWRARLGMDQRTGIHAEMLQDEKEVRLLYLETWLPKKDMILSGKN